MTQIRIDLIGGMSVTVDDLSVTHFATDKSRALLAYLAIEPGRPHSRRTLASLFWPDLADRQALDNLRNTLYRLRRTLDETAPGTSDRLLMVTRHNLELRRAEIQCDVLELQARARAVAQHNHPSLAACPTCLATLEEATDLYHGELLEGMSLPDTEAFDEWLTLHREYLHHLALKVFSDLALAREAQGQFTRAHDIASRLIALDPYREDSRRLTMRVLARQGLPDQALAQYESLRQLLRDALGTEPDARTTALAHQIAASPPSSAGSPAVPATLPPATPQTNWSGAPIVAAFFGRSTESEQIKAWLTDDGCQLVVLLGMGGMGKSTLAACVARAVTGDYDAVVWRSLLNAPRLDETLMSVLQALSGPAAAQLPDSLDNQLSLVLAQLRQQHCLLVLDNVESILQPEVAGQFLAGYENYGQLFRLVGMHEHQSCLMLTSRERPVGLGRLERESGRVRTLPVAGLDDEAGTEILASHGLVVSAAAARRVVRRYSGNPLALNLVAQTIRDFHAGDADDFLAHEAPIFDDVRDVLDEQVGRLNPLQLDTLRWLAVAREPMSLPALESCLIEEVRRRDAVEALRALQRRSLLEQHGDGFGLQNVVTEHLTERLVGQVCREIESGQVDVLRRVALLHAQANDTVRTSQTLLLLKPSARRLQASLGPQSVDEAIRGLLDGLRQHHPRAPGYTAGNLLNLLLCMGRDVARFDFSNLAVWQASLQDETLPGINLAGSDLTRSTFTDTFSTITSVGFSPTGRILAAASADGDIRLWRATDGALAAILVGHDEVVLAIALSPDGRLLASGGVDTTVRLWDVSQSPATGSGLPLAVLRGHSSSVYAIAFSPDGQTLASGSRDGTVRLWDLTDATAAPPAAARKTLPNRGAAITALAFGPAGRRMVSGDGAGLVQVWDLGDDTAGAAICHEVQGHEGRVNGVVFCHEGRLLATCGNDETVRIWDLHDGAALTAGTPRHMARGHQGWVLGVDWEPGGGLLASCGTDQTIRLWPITPGGEEAELAPQDVLPGHVDWVRSIAFSPDGKTLVSGGDDRTVRFWNLRKRQVVRTLHGFRSGVFALAFWPDGRSLVSGGADMTLRRWRGIDAAGGTVAGDRALPGHTGRITTVAVHPAGRLVASGGDDAWVHVWDASAGRLERSLQGHGRWVGAVTFSPDGHRLATAGQDGSIRLWRLATAGATAPAPEPEALLVHTKPVFCLTFSPDGRLVASGSADNTVVVCDVDSCQVRHVLRGHDTWVRAVAFSPDGGTVASGGADHVIRLWSMSDGHLAQALEGHPSWVRTLAFSPDGHTLASGGNDYTVRLWDVATGTLRETLRDHHDMVWSVAFSPDGRTLASGAGDETIHLRDPLTGVTRQIVRVPGPYDGMRIAGITGLTAAQRTALIALGAVER